jgi:hypothetical protein
MLINWSKVVGFWRVSGVIVTGSDSLHHFVKHSNTVKEMSMFQDSLPISFKVILQKHFVKCIVFQYNSSISRQSIRCFSHFTTITTTYSWKCWIFFDWFWLLCLKDRTFGIWFGLLPSLGKKKTKSVSSNVGKNVAISHSIDILKRFVPSHCQKTQTL